MKAKAFWTVHLDGVHAADLDIVKLLQETIEKNNLKIEITCAHVNMNYTFEEPKTETPVK